MIFLQPFSHLKLELYTTSHLCHLKKMVRWMTCYPPSQKNKMCKYAGLTLNLGLDTGPFGFYSWAFFWKGFYFLKNLNLKKYKKIIHQLNYYFCIMWGWKCFCHLTFFLKKSWFLFSLFSIELFWFYNPYHEFDGLT